MKRKRILLIHGMLSLAHIICGKMNDCVKYMKAETNGP